MPQSWCTWFLLRTLWTLTRFQTPFERSWSVLTSSRSKTLSTFSRRFYTLVLQTFFTCKRSLQHIVEQRNNRKEQTLFSLQHSLKWIQFRIHESGEKQRQPNWVFIGHTQHWLLNYMILISHILWEHSKPWFLWFLFDWRFCSYRIMRCPCSLGSDCLDWI